VARHGSKWAAHHLILIIQSHRLNDLTLSYNFDFFLAISIFFVSFLSTLTVLIGRNSYLLDWLAIFSIFSEIIDYFVWQVHLLAWFDALFGRRSSFEDNEFLWRSIWNQQNR
jgi:hypothetical protein